MSVGIPVQCCSWDAITAHLQDGQKAPQASISSGFEELDNARLYHSVPAYVTEHHLK